MALPLSPTIPIDLGGLEPNAKASVLAPWFTTGQQKAIYDLLKEYHAEDLYPALVQMQAILDQIITDSAAPSVYDQNDGLPLFFWKGTQAEYDVILTPDPRTLYIVT